MMTLPRVEFVVGKTCRILSFHCVHCPKEQNQKTVSLSTCNSEQRNIY